MVVPKLSDVEHALRRAFLETRPSALDDSRKGEEVGIATALAI
jgi:hypothetical protein